MISNNDYQVNSIYQIKRGIQYILANNKEITAQYIYIFITSNNITFNPEIKSSQVKMMLFVFLLVLIVNSNGASLSSSDEKPEDKFDYNELALKIVTQFRTQGSRFLNLLNFKTDYTFNQKTYKVEANNLSMFGLEFTSVYQVKDAKQLGRYTHSLMITFDFGNPMFTSDVNVTPSMIPDQETHFNVTVFSVEGFQVQAKITYNQYMKKVIPESLSWIKIPSFTSFSDCKDPINNMCQQLHNVIEGRIFCQISNQVVYATKKALLHIKVE